MGSVCSDGVAAPDSHLTNPTQVTGREGVSRSSVPSVPVLGLCHVTTLNHLHPPPEHDRYSPILRWVKTVRSLAWQGKQDLSRPVWRRQTTIWFSSTRQCAQMGSRRQTAFKEHYPLEIIPLYYIFKYCQCFRPDLSAAKLKTCLDQPNWVGQNNARQC